MDGTAASGGVPVGIADVVGIAVVITGIVSAFAGLVVAMAVGATAVAGWSVGFSGVIMGRCGAASRYIDKY